jgi:hypothetical protein
MTGITRHQRRAIRIERLLTSWLGHSNSQEALVDPLTDSMHWCDANGEDFHLSLAQACRHYINELNDEQLDERRLIP